MCESNLVRFESKNAMRVVGVLIGGCLGLTLCLLVDRLIDFPFLDSSFKEPAERQFEKPHQSTAYQSNQTSLVESPSLKRQRLVQTLENMGVEQIIQLLDEVRETTVDRQSQLVQEHALGELARRDPHAALEQVWRTKRYRWGDLVGQVFGEWSVQNLEEAIEIANSLEGSLKHNAITSILSRRDDLTDAQRLTLAESHGFEILAKLVISEEKAVHHSHQPQVALQLLLDDEVDDYAQTSLLAELATNWVYQEGSDAYLPLLKALNGTRSYTQSYKLQLLRAIIQQLVQDNPREVWAECLKLPSNLRSTFYEPILWTWVALNPKDAYDAISETTDLRAQSEQLRKLFNIWARSRPRDLLNNIQLIPETHKSNSIGWAIGELARHHQPLEALDQLGRMASQAEDVAFASERLVAFWARTNPIEAVEWILVEDRDIDVDHLKLLSIALPLLADANTEKAIELLRSPTLREHQEVDANAIAQLEVEVLTALSSNGKFDSALDVLEVVDSSRKLDALRRLGITLIEFNQPDKAIELARDLPESSRVEYFGTLAHYWVVLNPRQLVDSIHRLPSEAIRKYVATTVWNYRERTNLTDEQIMYLKGLIQPNENE